MHYSYPSRENDPEPDFRTCPNNATLSCEGSEYVAIGPEEDERRHVIGQHKYQSASQRGIEYVGTPCALQSKTDSDWLGSVP